MTQSSPTAAGTSVGASGNAIAKSFGAGYIFGVPVGGMGWFASLLMGVASGFMAFFAATFLAIVAVLFYNSVWHGSVDFAATYRVVGLPVGLVVMVLALGYLGTLWVKRMLRKG